MRVGRCIGLCAAALLVAFTPHDRTAPDRWALVIGISDYMNFGDEIGGDLPGAAPDAIRMRDVLVARWGFQENRIRLILDHDATRERIIRELSDWLPSVVKPGDLVVFYFAGHGSQTWNEDGTAADGLDQTICPTDVLRGDPARDIRDKELGGYLRALATDNVVAILDNCHAGTGTRDITPFMRPRFLDRAAALAERPAVPIAPVGVPAPRHDNILEIAAAQSHEVAVDAEWPAVDGGAAVFGGAFTTHLVRNLWRVPRRTSYEDVFAKTVEDMKRDRFAQQPMLQRGGLDVIAGPATGGPAFAVNGDVAAEGGFAPVLGVTGGRARLAGGAAAGMTVGSVYRVGDAELRVTAVDAAEASATIEGDARAARAGAQAQLVAYSYPSRTLRVSVAALAAPTRAALAGSLGGTPAIELIAGARDFAHLLVRPADDGGYIVLGLDGATRFAASPGAGALAAIATALRHEAGAHQLASLENPAYPFALEFGFAGGRTAFRVGDRVAFDARVPRDGYLTIVDIGPTGRVIVLYPNALEPDNRVRAGQRVTLPTPAMDMEFEAQIAGRGIVRAFLTDRPLELPFTEGEPEEATAVVRALYGAVGGDGAGRDALPVDNWATVAVVYLIER